MYVNVNSLISKFFVFKVELNVSNCWDTVVQIGQKILKKRFKQGSLKSKYIVRDFSLLKRSIYVFFYVPMISNVLPSVS